MSTVFEIPEWDEDVPKNGIKFQVNQSKRNKKGKKKVKQSSDSEDDVDNEPGRFVRLFNPNHLEEDNKKTKTKKCKSKKRAHESDDESESSPPPKKKLPKKKKEIVAEKQEGPKVSNKKTQKEKLVEATADQKKETNSWANHLIDDLKASRFRFINEQLYSTTSDKARNAFEDPEAFKTYHEGYQNQVQKWPMNPLDRIIKSIKKLPKTHVIADFGCGEAKLAKSVYNKVYSLDLVAAVDGVIAGDMAHTPLDNGSIDVAVFCLSLMGTNLKDFILEANRVLKIGGILKIAEVQSRFDNVKQFNSSIEKCGFELIYNDWTNKLFYFIHFKKINNVAKAAKVPDFSLNPCLYKKR